MQLLTKSLFSWCVRFLHCLIYKVHSPSLTEFYINTFQSLCQALFFVSFIFFPISVPPQQPPLDGARLIYHTPSYLVNTFFYLFFTFFFVLIFALNIVVLLKIKHKLCYKAVHHRDLQVLNCPFPLILHKKYRKYVSIPYTFYFV